MESERDRHTDMTNYVRTIKNKICKAGTLWGTTHNSATSFLLSSTRFAVVGQTSCRTPQRDEETQQTTVVTMQTRQVSSCLARITGRVVMLSLCSGAAWHNSCWKGAGALAWQCGDIRADCSIWETSACEYWLWMKERAAEWLNRWINKRAEWRNDSLDASFINLSNYSSVYQTILMTYLPTDSYSLDNVWNYDQKTSRAQKH